MPNEPTNVVAFDCETYPIRSTEDDKAGQNPVPKFVCAAFFEAGDEDAELLRGEKAVQRWLAYVQDKHTKIVGHNLSFDHSVMLRAAWDVCGEDYIPEILRAYENPANIKGGSMSDTKIRQKLIDVATIGFFYRRTGGYSLEDLVGYYLDDDISGWKGADSWRLRYNELDDYGTDVWPEDAVRYAKNDPIWTLKVWQRQNQPKNSALGPKVVADEQVVNEEFQAKADFAFGLLRAWGIGVNQGRARALRKRYRQRRDTLREKLQGWGLVDSAGKNLEDRQRELYAQSAKKAGIEPARTDKDNKIATNKEARAKLRLQGFRDEKIQTLEAYSRVEDYLTKYLKPLCAAAPEGLFPNWNTLVRSGRSSSNKPNMQNFPKRKHPNEAIPADSIRKCFEPREGNTFVNADWSSAELRSLAQINFNWRHDPEMAKVLREGRDLHLDFAAQIEGVDYEEARRKYQRGDDDISKARKVAKVANFGFPGGLEAGRFVLHAFDFGIELSYSEAKKLRHAWLNRWSEMPNFFRRVKNHRASRNSYPIQQHAPGGVEGQSHPWRIRRCESWTSAANTLFQGMVGDGAKAALWTLVVECFADKSSPLYGARVNAFVHDEFLLECPPDQAYQAGRRLRDIMVDSMELFTTDVPCEADVDIGDVWGEGEEVDYAK